VVLFGNGDLESMEVGISIAPNNPDLNFQIARTYHNFMLEDEDQVVSKFKTSIQNNPLFTSSWLELSEIFLDKGEEEKALLALNRAYELAPLSIARLWQGSILALRLGQEDMAYEKLRVFATADPELRTAVFDTIWLVTSDNDFILNEVITDEVLLSYINYIITTKRADASLAAWERMESLNEIQVDKQFLDYMNFLIDNQKSRQAYVIWSKIVGSDRSDSFAWNGGFDWRVMTDENPGVLMIVDSERSIEGKNAFKLKSNGKNNNNFYHFYQIVPAIRLTNLYLELLG